METEIQRTIGKIVTEDYRKAAIFSKYGIDFCCKGNLDLDSACAKMNLDKKILLGALAEVDEKKENGISKDIYADLPLDILMDIIEKKFHQKIRQQTPIINNYLSKLSKSHGEQHPELYVIQHLFFESSLALAGHLEKEENLLFPYIRQIFAHEVTKNPKINFPFGNIQNPILLMQKEHQAEGDRFLEIAELCLYYRLPKDGDSAYKMTYNLLKEFESDLRFHIHIENNILFPKAISLTQ
jgi:regulator of cell morphogenesis and NO signaling